MHLELVDKLDAVYSRVRESLLALGYRSFELSRGYLYAALSCVDPKEVFAEFAETYVYLDKVGGRTFYLPLVSDREVIRRDLQGLLDRGLNVTWFETDGLKGAAEKLFHECEIDTAILKFEGPDFAKRRKEMGVIDRRYPVTVAEGGGEAVLPEIEALQASWLAWKASRPGEEHIPDPLESQALMNAVRMSETRPGLYRVFRFYAADKLQACAVTSDEGAYWCRLFVRTLPEVPALHLWIWRWLAQEAYKDLPLENDGADIDLPSLKNSWAKRKVNYYAIKPSSQASS